jgi:predicted dinucleotide-binding enzyme
MRIGILGSGLMGGKLGTVFAHAGHDVVFSYSNSQRKLKRTPPSLSPTPRRVPRCSRRSFEKPPSSPESPGYRVQPASTPD